MRCSMPGQMSCAVLGATRDILDAGGVKLCHFIPLYQQGGREHFTLELQWKVRF
jgi:hypothetical protein